MVEIFMWHFEVEGLAVNPNRNHKYCGRSGARADLQSSDLERSTQHVFEGPKELLALEPSEWAEEQGALELTAMRHGVKLKPDEAEEAEEQEQGEQQAGEGAEEEKAAPDGEEQGEGAEQKEEASVGTQATAAAGPSEQETPGTGEDGELGQMVPAAGQGSWVPVTGEDGSTYYLNEATGESSWELPGEQEAVADPWQQVQDENGEWYWWNSATGESSW